jgi:hypothetical protein
VVRRVVKVVVFSDKITTEWCCEDREITMSASRYALAFQSLSSLRHAAEQIDRAVRQGGVVMADAMQH